MPEFRMPTCWRHFFKGHRWWCRACDREAERDFKQLAEAWWASQKSIAAAEEVIERVGQRLGMESVRNDRKGYHQS